MGGGGGGGRGFANCGFPVFAFQLLLLFSLLSGECEECATTLKPN